MQWLFTIQSCFFNFILCVYKLLPHIDVIKRPWMSKLKLIRQINETEYCTDNYDLVPTFQQKNDQDMRGGIQEYLWPSNPPIFWVESWKKLCQSLTRCLKVVPMILSLYHGSTFHLKPTFDAVLPLETSHPFCVPLICDQCSYFDHRHPFFPIKILYHTHLIYIAGKSWIIVISSLLPLQSDFLWFLIIFRALQNCDFLKL